MNKKTIKSQLIEIHKYFIKNLKDQTSKKQVTYTLEDLINLVEKLDK